MEAWTPLSRETALLQTPPVCGCLAIDGELGFSLCVYISGGLKIKKIPESMNFHLLLGC